MKILQQGTLLVCISLLWVTSTLPLLAAPPAVPAARVEPAVEKRGSFLVDPRPAGRTPKFLGVCLEVAEDAQRSNLWDWVADSGVNMTRLIHPDRDIRRFPGEALVPNFVESKEAKIQRFKQQSAFVEVKFKGIQNKQDFEVYRARLRADPVRNLPWKDYAFDQRLPWLGVADDAVRKACEAGIMPIVSMAYGPQFYPRSLLNTFADVTQPKDEAINWGAAASAYEYYFANIHRYTTRQGVSHYMLINEPDERDLRQVKQIGVLARLARLAMEDVRGSLADQAVAKSLRLSAPACHFGWEEFWPYVEPYVDFLDFHFYDPNPAMFLREYKRCALRARATGKKVAFTEFNRIGGSLQPDQALFSMKPSLQLGALVMSVLSAGQAQDPGCEMALTYQFQFPATHRSFKSLVYGDMNLVDWSGQDKALNQAGPEAYPTFEQLQVRMATPAYHVFKMLARCTPGAGERDSFEVLDCGESAKGFGATWDRSIEQNIYEQLHPAKFYSLGGVGAELRVLAVRTPERLIITVLNAGPTAAKRIGFNCELLAEHYATAVVRETSLNHRDRAMQQLPLPKNKELIVDLPPEALTQIIFTKDDLTQIKELKLVEKTVTPGTAQQLGLLQTTRLRALGRLGDRWIDLTELNVNWTTSAPELVAIYQGGLVQRRRDSVEAVTLTAVTLAGVAAPVVTVPASLPSK